MVPFNTKHKCLNFVVTETFHCASGVAIGILLVNEEPEILGLETHIVPRARCVEG